MNDDLRREAVVKLGFTFGVMALFLFGAAGTMSYLEGWIFLAVFFGSSVAVSLDVANRDPALLARRVKGGPMAEKSPTQQIIQALAAVVFLGALVLPALDHRFGWSFVAWPFVVLGNLLVILGMWVVLLVFRANTYAFAVIEVDPGQRVVSNGLYAYIRHPMYAGALIMFMGVPLALGSWWGLLAVLPIKWILIWRLVDEERFLSKNLPGYADYLQKVKYRLVPGIW